MRPLPSDSKIETVPVSATPMLVPETATLACRNFLRRWGVPPRLARSGRREESRSVLHAIRITPGGCGGSQGPRCGWACRRQLDDLGEVGLASVNALFSPPECSLRFVSWVAMDLTLTISILQT